MRDVTCDALLSLSEDPNFVFLTGDLGFMALEPLQERLGQRFVNAGIAEQNMVSVAAALCSQGLRPWVYSIAPFIYARAFEQVRNDVALHNLPVKFIGNGGGYGYGVMGPTHHSLEDYGVLGTIQNLRIFIPAFDTDVKPSIEMMSAISQPSYLRLGRDESPKDFVAPAYAPWRKVRDGNSTVIITVGPIVGSLLDIWQTEENSPDPSVWTLSELPVQPESMPLRLVDEITNCDLLVFVEEHVTTGSVASQVILTLACEGVRIPRVKVATPRRNHLGVYGSQQYLRSNTGLSPTQIHALIQDQVK
jgi:transketolase